MKKRIISMVLAMATAFSITACANSGSSSSVQGANPSDSEEIVIDVMWQQEVTETFMNYPIEELKKKYPDVTVNLVISPQAFSEINNLLAAQNAPDVFFTWVSEVDYYGMAKEGLLYPVDDLLAMDSADGGETLAQRISKLGVQQGEYDGKHYLLPVTQYKAANFYNAAYFEKAGITPKLDTLEEFEETCKAIAAKGEAVPLIYAGVYPFMVMDAFIFPMLYNTDPAAVEAINNNEKGAWVKPSVVECVKKWEALVKAGYVSQNSLAMDHIQSQIEFINNRAAFVPVGTWLEGEMGDQWPEDFKLTPFFAPATGASGQSAVSVMEYMILPKQKDDVNLPYVQELVKLFYSKENAERCLKETGALMAVETVDETLAALLPPSAQAAQKLGETVTAIFPAYKLNNKTLFTESCNAINALTSGEMTAEQFCEKMDSLV